MSFNFDFDTLCLSENTMELEVGSTPHDLSSLYSLSLPGFVQYLVYAGPYAAHWR